MSAQREGKEPACVSTARAHIARLGTLGLVPAQIAYMHEGKQYYITELLTAYDAAIQRAEAAEHTARSLQADIDEAYRHLDGKEPIGLVDVAALRRDQRAALLREREGLHAAIDTARARAATAEKRIDDRCNALLADNDRLTRELAAARGDGRKTFSELIDAARTTREGEA